MMSLVRSLNIITLSAILVLAGCFGFGDTTEATPGGTTMSDYPAVTVDLMLPEWDCDGTGTCTTEVYHAAVHPAGDSMTMGWDTDLDGAIDVPVTVNQGFTEISIQESEFEIPVNNDLVIRHTMAFIAEDSNGHTTASMLTVYHDDYVFGNNGNGGGTLMMWTFSGRDAADTMSDAGEEKLVHIAMDQGTGLSWSVVKVSIVVEGGNAMTCIDDASSSSTNAACTFTIDDTDSEWNVPEEITVNEGASDLCDGTDGGCDISVTITKLDVAGGNDHVLAQIQTYADASN